VSRTEPRRAGLWSVYDGRLFAGNDRGEDPTSDGFISLSIRATPRRYHVGVGRAGKQWGGTTQMTAKIQSGLVAPGRVRVKKPFYAGRHSRRIAAQTRWALLR